MSRPRLLDLFCCEGGAGMGYRRAGFEVFGVDLRRNLRYPFHYHRGDALAYLDRHGAEFDAIHASPPCQAITPLRHLHTDDLEGMLFPIDTHTDLLEPTRALLRELGVPWVMENVPGAEMIDPITLCGSQFDLGTVCRDGQYRELRRHRLFESDSIPLRPRQPCRHIGQPLGVYGHGGGKNLGSRGYQGDLAESRRAMGMPWAGRIGVSEAIPPAYTEWIGRLILNHLQGKAPGQSVVVSPVGLTRGENGVLRGPSVRSREPHSLAPYIDETCEPADYHAGGE